jgi:neopullulanase
VLLSRKFLVMIMKINVPAWVKDAVFYQIFPDRFATSRRVPKAGLKLEDWETAPTPYGFKGGDLLGIVEHLDYLQDLGITAIYLNPIFASASNHRYHTYDYYNVDPLLGGNAALRELLDAAHARGIKVVLDGVFNHASRGFWQFHHVLENGAGSPYLDWFHFNPEFLSGKKHWGAYPSKKQSKRIRSGMNSIDAIGYSAWWNLPALPKLNTATPAVRKFIFEVAEYWIKFGIDGWRLDVPAEIDDDSFWQEFRQRVKKINPEAYIVGEIWQESQRWLQGDQFDAVMNYLVTGALIGLLVGEKISDEVYHCGDYGKFVRPLSTEEFAERIDYLQGLYDPAINHAQLNLIDSHDTPRFLSIVEGDKSSLKLAWFFLMTYPGAPCIYYGDEIGLDGHHDPDCRKSFPWQDKRSWDKTLRNYLQELIAIRKAHSTLSRGSYQKLFAKDNVIAFSRIRGKEKYIVLMNTASTLRRIEIPVETLAIPEGQLETIFGKADATLRAGKISLALPKRSGVILKA